MKVYKSKVSGLYHYEITKNVTVIMDKGRVIIHMEKHKPVIIDSDDKCPKGFEVAICSKCRNVREIVMTEGCEKRRKHYCIVCSDKVLAKR